MPPCPASLFGCLRGFFKLFHLFFNTCFHRDLQGVVEAVEETAKGYAQGEFDNLGFGEVLPQHKNHFKLDYDNLDQWGLPQYRFDAGHFHENEGKKWRRGHSLGNENDNECLSLFTIV